ncbi:DUF983 domain-containing protein [Methylopila turkensis]|uniref:DUF983 domain-containing protein n=1 Tax=Methylopila turkensis TaxID=1437816 RepID=A0A9W6JS65_9HYPH|nr:DUF983 domain-containing protein [Methylopila turkensis]GLK80809.1 hypothetical protein GCM10008174_25500 [Methylopila turkensis]
MTLEPHRHDESAEGPPRAVAQAIGRGLKLRCPACGEGRLFRAYLKVNDACPACGEALHHQRADDAPPYVVISIVAHVIVAALMAVELTWKPEIWVHLVLWIPLTIAMSLALLPPVKGALVGLQWALRMHGFGGADDDAHLAPAPAGRGPRA